ncbi:MAG: hypothetical protein JWM20_298 [Patescibacteria group bacterium]|nr:hypothetical protein [Patescibacteria group bacterium]
MEHVPKSANKSGIGKALLLGILAMGIHHGVSAKSLETSEKGKASGVPELVEKKILKKSIAVIDDVPTPVFNLEKAYNKNKSLYDSRFDNLFSVDVGDSTIKLVVKHHGPDHMTIKVRHALPEGGFGNDERFNSLDEMAASHPQYRDAVEKASQANYQEHVLINAWDEIVSEQEASVHDNIEQYVPSEEELAVIRDAVMTKKAGGNTDGYDEIYHYYKDAILQPGDLYKFIVKYKHKPDVLAEHMKQKYFDPLVAAQ